MRWRFLAGQDNDFSVPGACSSAFSCPLNFTECFALANVVYPTNSALRSGRECDSRGNVLYVSARCADGRHILSEQNERPPIIHALKKRKETMDIVSR